MDTLRRLVARLLGRQTEPDEQAPVTEPSVVDVPYLLGVLEELSTDARPYISRDGQEPPYIPYSARFIQANINGQQRLAALINKGLLDELRVAAIGGRNYRRDLATSDIDMAALRQFREYFESEQESARIGYETAVVTADELSLYRRFRRIGRKLVQLTADEKRHSSDLSLLRQEAIEHLQTLMTYIEPVLQDSGFIPRLINPVEPQMSEEFRQRYRMAYGDDGSSAESDSPGSEPRPEQAGQDSEYGGLAGEIAPPSLTASEQDRIVAASVATARRNLRINASWNFKDRREDCQQARRDLDGRVEGRRDEGRLLQQRVLDGDADPAELADFQRLEYEIGQAFTRALIEAEEQYRAQKIICQELRVDLIDDGVSSMFPDLSEDDPEVDNNQSVRERAQVLEPAITRWRQELPDLPDTLAAAQEEWTRRPDVDEWEATSVKDYDSRSLVDEETKRKRIMDAVVAENQARETGAVAEWVRQTNKRPKLFHQRDATFVFSRARE